MCDAMHFAEELTARYRKTRKALPAISISDPAFLTCVGNDFGFDYIFQGLLRQMQKMISCLPSVQVEKAKYIRSFKNC